MKPHRVSALARLVGRRVRNNQVLWAFALGLAAFSFYWPEKIPCYPGFVDWPTMYSLTGLLIITTAIKESSLFGHLARRMLARVKHERGLALVLVTASALLAMFLTNDVTLFILVPLTLALRDSLQLDSAKFIIFEALAVNVGSSLTPIGNPQNLFIWHQYKVPFVSFVYAMLPLELLLLGVLLLFTCLVFRPAPLDLRPAGDAREVDKKLLAGSLAAFLLFVVAIDLGRSGLGLVGVGLGAMLFCRRVLLKIDWPLLLLFLLMFIDLHLVAQIPLVREGLAGLGLAEARNLYLVGLVSSQLLSNVPAAMLVSKFSSNWVVLAYAVNVGASGLVIGSLANIIALRMAEAPGVWLRFHKYSLPFLLMTAGAVFFIL